MKEKKAQQLIEEQQQHADHAPKAVPVRLAHVPDSNGRRPTARGAQPIVYVNSAFLPVDAYHGVRQKASCKL